MKAEHILRMTGSFYDHRSILFLHDFSNMKSPQSGRQVKNMVSAYGNTNYTQIREAYGARGGDREWANAGAKGQAGALKQTHTEKTAAPGDACGESV